ncbi:amylo-alpha-1,6-glucosidase [Aquabacterium sp.]|uniref:amylo-alpha-1,6-glucosidase n=1 Tax=Aquabacterium sp. TaxID=1872578 RepID=UPI002C01AD42|nr:glycoside hydrolase 100 family protein [Aquabacterium sp.]HSW03174.1 glycoside hydrolase 100 family protein [Aquabacterium sp.]
MIAAGLHASLALLRRNLSPHGILAASRTEAAEARRYTRIFGRDAAICVLAMCGSGDSLLEQAAVASLEALAKEQAANGQIPKYVDPDGADADFWYLGCIDATLWWLIAVDHVRRHGTVGATHWQDGVARAIRWLQAQEHQRFRLLQQNEASDWADIMPRSGYVLYTNALWVEVKRRFALPDAQATHQHFNHLFDPFQRDLPEYHRARLLQHYARRGRRDPGLYLSFVNLAFAGNEGDVFGNLLAILCGAASESKGHGIVQTLGTAGAAHPYPIRVVLHPLSRQHALWQAYMVRHQQNLVHQYHNGGIWPFVGGFWVMALARLGLQDLAWQQLGELARVNSLDDWRFTEWFHGRTLAPMGMAGQSWNAATFVLAHRALTGSGAAW